MKALFVIFTFIIIVGGSLTTFGAQFFLEGFEYEIPLTERGYIINSINDPDMKSETSKSISSTGERSLWMKSELNSGFVEIILPLDVTYLRLVYFSFHIFLVSNFATIRIELMDNEKVMSLDYGQIGDSWEELPIFNVNSSFIKNAWQIENRNLDVDIKTALEHPDNPFSVFTPNRISAIKIIQDSIGGDNELFLDDVEINNFGNTELSDLLRKENDSSLFPVLVPLSSIYIGLVLVVIYKNWKRSNLKSN